MGIFLDQSATKKIKKQYQKGYRMTKPVRVRFAPSPTGFMHLGSVRIAVFNYMFAKKNRGSFILRIEDTDQKRNLEESQLQILKDLEWLRLPYNEGPIVGGAYGPYLQSERASIHQEKLNELISIGRVYRCFCTAEHLEEKRQRATVLGLPPRYDRTCAHLSDDKVKAKIADGQQFVWRFRLNDLQVIEINDMAMGKVSFDMKNFSDFVVARADGTFPFMFANMVDDWTMEMTHIIRGSDHLSNTAMQAALYDAFAVPLPTFWHLPLVCNIKGEKLSKRDFGFSLTDLRNGGFLAPAVINYLATIGFSIKEEIQSLDDLIKIMSFENLHASSTVKYDLEKVTWFNHKWMERVDVADLAAQALPFIEKEITAAKELPHDTLIKLISAIRSDMKTLADAPKLLAFYFTKPIVTREGLEKELGKEKTDLVLHILKTAVVPPSSHDLYISHLKEQGVAQGLKAKEILGSVRYVLTGSFQGMGLHDLFAVLGTVECEARIGVVSGW